MILVPLADLWLPILLSGVFVFIASSLLHMVIPMHRSDYSKLSGEDAVLAAIRDAGVAPGDYMFPCPGSMKEMNTPEFQERFRRGPVGNMTLLAPGSVSMGRSLALWFVFTLVVSTFVAYLGGLALAPGAEYRLVFRVTGTAAILGYAFTNATNSIWKGVRWSTTFKFVIDGVVYGLVTGGTFGWLWPDAA